MRLEKRFACGTAVAVFIGSVGLSSLLVTNASASATAASQATLAGADGGHIMIGPTGNKVEMIDPANSTYIPKVAQASARDRAKSQRLLDRVNNFCSNHTAEGLKVHWRSGENNPNKPTHLFNPDPDSKGLRPANPRAALIYGGKLGGVMFTGIPLPSLGDIPRAHGHSMTRPIEMVHVYCTKNLKEAFTPNRTLGVLADAISLRLRIRPALMDLNEHQLRQVLAKVRGYLGNSPQAVSPVTTKAASGPDPVLRAIRVEIRSALMHLREGQLRSVWRLMQAYR